MTPALALSPLTTGIQPKPVVGRALLDFDLALGITLTPVSTVAAAPTIPDGAAEIDTQITMPQSSPPNSTLLQGAPIQTALALAVSGQSTVAACIPTNVMHMLAAENATNQTVANKLPIAAAIPWNVARRLMTDAVARKEVLPAPHSEPAVHTDEDMPAADGDSDVLPTDDNNAASTENAIGKPEDVGAPVLGISLPTIPAPTVYEKASNPASAPVVSKPSRDQLGEVDARVAARLSPAMPREANIARQTANVLTANLTDEDAPTKRTMPFVTEPQIKSAAFESAPTFNITTASAEVRQVGLAPAQPLAELSGASGVAERHLNLARDTLWLDQLANDIVSASDRTDHVSFRLVPAHLGRLDVELITGDTGLSVNIATSTAEAGKIVASAQPSLVESLQAQGIRVADTQVTTGNDTSRHNQPQRQNAAHHLIETAFNGADEPADQNDERLDGRFA